ncbi:hypothetical protein L1049_011914 [Liquidambar formosana]|uniref:DUF4216 domain-containing protein n=1 Tax=Liquidambar formosana TaxID=63359 RepID=A0AAP0RT66_LIQFO
MNGGGEAPPWGGGKEHKKILEQAHVRNIDQMHKEEFVQWFEQHVTQLYRDSNGQVDEQMLSLARGPEKRVTCWSGYNVNGFRFNTKKYEKLKKTQNSGVMVRGESQKEEMNYYGELVNVVELHYTGGNRVVLFKCDWWDIAHLGSGFKIDRHGFISVNSSQRLNTSEPFVLACQATQVFYVKGIKDPDWYIVVKTKPRNLFDMPSGEDEHSQDDDAYQESEPDIVFTPAHEENNMDEEVVWNRNDVEGEIIDENVVLQEKANQNNDDNITDDDSDAFDIDEMLVDD